MAAKLILLCAIIFNTNIAKIQVIEAHGELLVLDEAKNEICSFKDTLICTNQVTRDGKPLDYKKKDTKAGAKRFYFTGYKHGLSLNRKKKYFFKPQMVKAPTAECFLDEPSCKKVRSYSHGYAFETIKKVVVQGVVLTVREICSGTKSCTLKWIKSLELELLMQTIGITRNMTRNMRHMTRNMNTK
eukprot:764024_1